MDANKWQWEEIAEKSLAKARGMLLFKGDFMPKDFLERLATLVILAALAEDRARRDGEEALL